MGKIGTTLALMRACNYLIIIFFKSAIIACAVATSRNCKEETG